MRGDGDILGRRGEFIADLPVDRRVHFFADEHIEVGVESCVMCRGEPRQASTKTAARKPDISPAPPTPRRDSGEDVLHDVPGDIREPEIAAGVAIGESLVVEAASLLPLLLGEEGKASCVSVMEHVRPDEWGAYSLVTRTGDEVPDISQHLESSFKNLPRIHSQRFHRVKHGFCQHCSW